MSCRPASEDLACYLEVRSPRWAHVSQLESASRCTRPMRPAPITPACVQVGITGTRSVALHVHRIASGLTDVQHPIGQSHADRAPPSGGDAGAARAGQLQRIGGHGQRDRRDAQAHHGPDPDALSCDLSRPRGAAPADAKDAETPRRSATAETQERFLTQRTTNYVSASRSGQQQKPRIQPRELRCSPAA